MTQTTRFPEDAIIALTDASNRLAEAENVVARLRTYRDAAVISARAAGMTVEDVALTSGLSVARVYQIVSG